MSSSTMPFLRYLGLDDDADERAIRRAYALRLKAIDQEADPEGFQVLREAYATAMNWAHWRQQAAASEQVAESTLSVDTPTPLAEASAGRQEAPGPQAPARPDAREMAEEVRVELANAFRNRLFTTPEMMRARLDQSLDDPRLVDMDARFFFEWGVAAMLAGGWQLGYELLFDAATEAFDWRHDRARLFSLGQEGRFIDSAIIEFEAFNGAEAPIYYGASRQDIVKWLREEERPADQVLARCLQAVEHMAATYPHWLHIVTNTQNIPRWRDWEQRRINQRFDDVPSSPGPGIAQNAPSFEWSQLMWIGLLVLGLILALGLSAPVEQPAHLARRAPGNVAPPAPADPERSGSRVAPQPSRVDTAVADALISNKTSSIVMGDDRALYADTIRAAIRPHIDFMGEVPGNPVAEVRVELAIDGTVRSKVLSKASGLPSWDAAVLRAIDRTQRIPPDATGQVPPVMTISFRPKA